MSIGPIGRYTYLAFELNTMLDEGDVVSIEEMRRLVDDGTVFEWLDEERASHDDIEGSPVDPDVRDAILTVFRTLNKADPLRQFGVERNGIALLLAYCIEGIQQQEPLVRPQAR